jgi:hypothetical protein
LLHDDELLGSRKQEKKLQQDLSPIARQDCRIAVQRIQECREEEMKLENISLMQLAKFRTSVCL